MFLFLSCTYIIRCSCVDVALDVHCSIFRLFVSDFPSNINRVNLCSIEIICYLPHYWELTETICKMLIQLSKCTLFIYLQPTICSLKQNQFLRDFNVSPESNHYRLAHLDLGQGLDLRLGDWGLKVIKLLRL